MQAKLNLFWIVSVEIEKGKKININMPVIPFMKISKRYISSCEWAIAEGAMKSFYKLIIIRW